MVGFYVYCVVPAAHEPSPDTRGLDDSRVYFSAVGDLGIWISETERPAAGVDAAKIHNRVVEAAVTQDVTPVPVRFGQWASQLSVLATAIGGKAEWYHEHLLLFRGALEFGVRVLSTSAPPSAQLLRSEPTVTGLDYMKALRVRAAAAQAERDVVERVSAGLGEILGALVRKEMLELPRTPHGVLNALHLVARDRFDEYRTGVEVVRARFPELRFLLSGPWVPYSFAV